MKKISIFLLFVVASIITYGQVKSDKVEILWGKEFKASAKYALDIVGEDASGFYAIRTEKKGLFITTALERYDLEMNRSKIVKLDLRDRYIKRSFEFITMLNKKLYIFSSRYDKRNKKDYLYVQTIDKSTLLLNNDSKKIAEIDYSKKTLFNSGGFGFRMSRDDSKILIFYNIPNKKKEKERFGFHVYDENFSQIWEKNETLPYEESLFIIEDFKVDNNGNVHLLSTMYNEKLKIRKKGKPNYKYLILSYMDLGSRVEEYSIDVKDKFLTNMQIAITDEQNIICAGFYSKNGTMSIIGSYFLTLDGKTHETLSRSFKEFGIEFITQNMTKRQEKRTKKRADKGRNVEMYEYSLDEIILKSDGGAILIGEQYYVKVVTTTTTSSNGSRSTKTDYYYYYNDIIVINISPDGEIEWAEKIAKRQITANDNAAFSSYISVVSDNNLYFIFNDNMKNLDYGGEGKIYNFDKSKRSLVVLVELDGLGKQTRKVLFSAKEAEVLTRPLISAQVSENEVILFGQRRRKQRFAKLTFK